MFVFLDREGAGIQIIGLKLLRIYGGWMVVGWPLLACSRSASVNVIGMFIDSTTNATASFPCATRLIMRMGENTY